MSDLKTTAVDFGTLGDATTSAVWENARNAAATVTIGGTFASATVVVEGSDTFFGPYVTLAADGQLASFTANGVAQIPLLPRFWRVRSSGGAGTSVTAVATLYLAPLVGVTEALPSTLHDHRSSAEVCRARGWRVGQRLVGDEGRGPTPPGTAEVSASGLCDGVGDPDPRGAYVQLRIETATMEQRLRISRGAVEVLIAELQGVLANAR